MSLTTMRGSLVETILAIASINSAVQQRIVAARAEERAAVEAEYAEEIALLEANMAELRKAVDTLATQVGVVVFTPVTGDVVIDAGIMT